MIRKNKLRELKKIYKGSVSQFTLSKPSSNKSVHSICNTISLPASTSSDKIIREIRKK